MKQIFTNNLLRTALLLTTLLVGAGSAWAQTATIGTAALASATGTIGNPITRASATTTIGWSKSRQLYTAAQLTVAGVLSGASISSIAFRKTNAFTMGAGRTANLNVYMRNTAAVAYPATGNIIGDPIALGFTLVYTNAAYVMPATTGFIPITLTAPFAYTCGSVEVYVDWAPNGLSNGLTTGSFLWNYTANTGTAYQSMGATATAAIPNTAAATAQLRFYDVQFNYIAPAACSGTPSPGATVCSVSSLLVCSGTPFTLSLTNCTFGSGVTYQWQSKPLGGVFADIAGAMGSTYTTSQTARTTYQCVVTCAGVAGTSDPVIVRVNAPTACYCIPTQTGSAGITNLTFAGINNTTVAPGVTPFYTTETPTTTVYQGLTYTLSVSLVSAGSASVWIDYDRNGTFDASEWVQPFTNATTGTVSITIPLTASQGPTGLRIRSRLTGSPNGAIDACTAFGSGETENYIITIGPPPCAIINATAATLVDIASANANWTVATNPTSTATGQFYIEYSNASGFIPGSGTAAGDGTVIGPFSTLTAAITGLSSLTTYYYVVRQDCDGTGTTFTPNSNYISFTTIAAAPPAACPATFTPTNATTGFSRNAGAVLSWAAVGNTTDYLLTFGTNAPAYDNISNGVTLGNVTNYTIPGGSLLGSTTYGWKIVPSNVYGNATGCVANTFTTLATLSYCAAAATSTADEDIVNVTLGTMNNSSSSCVGAVGATYTDFRAVSPASIIKLVAAPMSLTSGACGSNYGNLFAVWIDYNQSGTFEAAEQVYASPASTSGPHTETTNIILPNTALTGLTGMRVMLRETSTVIPAGEACTSFTWGEVEDYTVDILPPPCAIITAAAASNITNVAATANWTTAASPVSTAVGSFYVEYGAPGFTPGTGAAAGTGTVIGPLAAGAVSASITGLTQTTTYQYVVRQACDVAATIFTYNSNAINFTTVLPVAPSCATGFAPVTGATGVSRNGGTVLSWAATANASAYRITLGTNAPAYDNILSSSDLGNVLSYTIAAGLIPTTTYGWTVVPYNGIGAATGCTANTFTSAATFTYCAVGATSTADEDIARVAFGSMDNSSSSCSGTVGAQYTDFRTTVAAPAIPVSVPTTMTLASATCGGNFGNLFAVWIDYNQDGIFQASEQVYASAASVSGPHTETPSITIPNTALPGQTIMRVMLVETTVPIAATAACTSFTWGEVEDYTINIVPLPAAPTAITEAASPSCTSGGSLSVAAAPAGIVYYWQGTTALGIDLSLNATTAYPIATNGTYYVRAYNPTYMVWSTTATSITVTDFPTGPAAPFIIATSPACNSANLTVGAAVSGVTYYWQGTNPVGTSTAQLADDGTTNTPYTVTTSNTYYVSARDNTTGCWSNTPASIAMTILATPTGTIAATQISSCTGGGSVSATVTNSVGGYNNDFSSAALSGASLYTAGTPGASIAGGVCTLTTNTASNAGSLVVNNSTGISSNAMTVDFDLTTSTGADGFSYSFGDDVTLGTSGNPEHGSGSKLRVGFDIFGASPDAAGIYLQYGATVTSGLTAATPGVLAYSTNTSFVNATSHITISVDNAGLATVKINGTPVAGMSGISLGAGYTAANKSAWKHAFAARTGGVSAVHQIDNLNIQYSANAYEYSLNGGTWQASSSFTGLAPNTYTVDVRHTSLPSCMAGLSPVVITPLATAFTTTSTAAAVCSTTSFTLGFTPTITGATYQWQSSPDGVAWTNIATATAATYTTTQAAATYYQCIVNCGSAIASSALQVTMNSFAFCYCTPLQSGGAIITNVTLNSLNNTSSSTATAPFYTQYPGTGAATTTLLQGLSYPITITLATAGIASVWIDYNQNGVYEDVTEWVQPFTSATTGTATISVPNTALLGITGMRVRTRGTGSPNTGADACTQFFSGETEDYVITIGAPTACAGTPVIGTATASVTTICGSGTSTLTIPSIALAGITYQWQSATATGGPYTNIAAATTATFALPTQTLEGTTYYVCNVTCVNGGASALSNELAISVKAAAAVSPIAPVICSNSGGTLLTATPATGATYQWSANAGSVTTPTYTAIAAGSYSVIVTQGTCITTATANVVVNAAPTVTATVAPTAVCEGSSLTLASVGVAVQPGYAASSIAYAPNTTAPFTTLVTGAVATPALTAGGLDDGYWSGIPLGFSFNYYGTAYTDLHISTNGNVQFGAAPNTSFSAQLLPNTVLPNNIIAAAWMDIVFSSSGTLKYATVGTAPNRKFIVDWNAPVFSGTDNAIAQLILSETTNTAEVHFQQFSNNVPKIFTIGVENAAGTAATTAPARNQVNISTTVDEAWRFTPNSLTYAWTGANAFTSAIQNPVAIPSATLAAAGAYTVTVTDMFGCTGTASVTTVVNAKPVATLTKSGNVGCGAMANVTLTAGTGTMYNFGTGMTAANTSIVTAGGNYIVTVQDANSCTATAAIVVTANTTPPVANVMGNFTLCTGSSTTLVASPGFVTYTWSGGTAGTSANKRVFNAAGTFSVVITGMNGCSTTKNFTVTMNTKPTLTGASMPAVCAGSALVGTVIMASTLSATTTWTANGYTGTGTTITRPNATTAMSGTYIIRSTNTCGTTSASTIASVKATLPITIAITNASVLGGSTGSIRVTAPASSTFSWTGSTVTTGVRTGLAAGTYTVTVTPPAGSTYCPVTRVIVVN